MRLLWAARSAPPARSVATRGRRWMSRRTSLAEEPPYVHVERERNKAKFWLDPVRLQSSGGYKRNEINRIQRLIEENRRCSWRNGMTTLAIELRMVLAQNVQVTDDALIVDLSDGRTISVPLAWFPRLLHGTPEERNQWRLIGDGEGIHWPAFDEDISVEKLILGKPSGESQKSFKKWLEARAKSE
jgi:Protein of unknown function (DUF2442)/Domain of unknown function (DUF4160)